MQIQALTVLARSEHARPLVAGILDGRIQEAAALAEEIVAGDGPRVAAAALPEIGLLCGDLMLALDRAEEAEECYRQAVKLAGSGPRGSVRVASCRGTGFMSLYQHRFGTAAACFARIVEDEAATPGHKVEALCALAVARHGLGQIERAMQALDDASEVAAETGVAELAMLASLVRVDLLAQQEIRAHEDLSDHVFWQRPAGAAVQLQPLAAIESCLAAHGQHALIARRLIQLRDLILATCGDARALAALTEHLAWQRRAGLVVAERQARLETALVAIAARQSELARATLEPLQSRGQEAVRPRWNLELWYCQAKVCALSGRIDESMRHYQRYALESMQCVRAESTQDNRIEQPRAATQAAKDDVESRLPAKYRRAYRYLLEHLDSAALSVREIAEHMGVTERALQSVFKSHLGMTPGEVMQRCRVERIRADLLREGAPGGTVIETAARWGIRNRSTLAASYRKYFRETPAETLARRGNAVARPLHDAQAA
jgi:AraC-like DNA-binding protein